MSLYQLKEHVDVQILGFGEKLKEFQKLLYEKTQTLLRIEALEGKKVASERTVSHAIYSEPSLLDTVSADEIACTLGCLLQPLLGVVQVPTLDLLSEESLLTTDEERKNVSRYAGMPTPQAIRELQALRARVQIDHYMLLSEIGLYSILAHRTEYSKFSRFKSVKREYADLFFAALPRIADLSKYRQTDCYFLWVEEETDRAVFKNRFNNIVGCLEVINILRGISA